ncbi:MAG: hypothetical protein Q7T33_09105, partial [Dehalococcoidia bacterium]|nr:hypothetical protein [Dehalococcoidia bacterium]
MQSVSHPPTARQRREERAEAEYEQYRFRLLTARATFHADGHTETLRAVMVTAPTGALYWVLPSGSCTCQDYERRGRESGIRCKHWHMVERYMAGRRQPCTDCGAPVAPAEAALGERAIGAVHCAGCREVLVEAEALPRGPGWR